jgi:hypothetical protein
MEQIFVWFKNTGINPTLGDTSHKSLVQKEPKGLLLGFYPSAEACSKARKNTETGWAPETEN